jgi:Ribonuclease H2 non-catalytic subunit (Ylr154p-like)
MITDDKLTVYYRGRKLRGRPVQLPEGYKGMMQNSGF